MRVLVLQNLIPNYSIPIYNILGRIEGIKLTVAHSGKPTSNKSKSYEEIIIPVFSIFSFFIHKINLYRYCSQFDVVIAMGDIRWLSIMKLGFYRKRKFRLLFWGIGVTASYRNKFDQKSIWQSVRFYLMKKADALIFYSDYPINQYSIKGFNPKKLFVAHNTVEVSNTINSEGVEKDRILFVGTLYKEKLIYELLEAFFMANKQKLIGLKLSIIGNGEEFENIKTWISEKGLGNEIFLHGEIFDEQVLEDYFKKSFACISPGQAGLTVLKSMGYGVPFITKKDAFTGGEIFNITDQVNGILYNNSEDLVEIISDISKNKYKYVEMGKKALEHYNQKRKPEIMVKGIYDAIEFVCRKK